jgi:DNA-binding MarR family transcriptional regulator
VSTPLAAEGRRAAAADREEALAAFSTAFKGAMVAVRRLRGRESQHPGELSYAQYSLLFNLAERGELPASELAMLADVAPATATGMLDALDGAGLVQRVRNPRDRRVVLVSLSPRGSEVVAERRARYEPQWKATFAQFSAEELRLAATVLERTSEVFGRMQAERACEADGQR